MGEEGAGDGEAPPTGRADTDQADQIATSTALESVCARWPPSLADRDRRLGVVAAAILDLVESAVISQRSSIRNAESRRVATQDRHPPAPEEGRRRGRLRLPW